MRMVNPVIRRHRSLSSDARTSAAAKRELACGASDSSFAALPGSPSFRAVSIARSSKYGRTHVQTS